MLSSLLAACGGSEPSTEPPTETPSPPPVPTATVSVAASAVTASRSSATSVVVTVVRGGGFAGQISLAVEGLPSGVTASFTDAVLGPLVSTTTLTFVVDGTVAQGTFPIIVRSTAVGVASSTAVLQLTVPAPSPLVAEVAFCDPTRFPVFFAVQDKGSTQWRTITPTAGPRYAFSFAQNVGTMAIVQLAPRNRQFPDAVFATYVTVVKGSTTELQDLLAQECGAHPARGKTLNGTLAPAIAAQSLAYVTGGWGNAFVGPSGSSFSLVDVEPASLDLMATRYVPEATSGTLEPDRIILRRGVNEPHNSVLAVLDFSSASAVVPHVATITAANLRGDRWSLRSALVPAQSADLAIFESAETVGATRKQFGLPVAQLGAGDSHAAILTAVNATNTSGRRVVSLTREVSTRTLTLGAELDPPMITNTTSSAPRPRARGTMQPDYDRSAQVLFTQGSPLKQVWVEEFAGFRGTSTAYDLEVPDLSNVPGFNPAWALTQGIPISYVVNLSNARTAGPYGYARQPATWLFASRAGIVP